MKKEIKIDLSVLLVILVLSNAEASEDTTAVFAKKVDKDSVASSQIDTTLFYASPPSHDYYMVAQSLKTPLGGILGGLVGTVAGAGVGLLLFPPNDIAGAIIWGLIFGRNLLPALTVTGAFTGYFTGCSLATYAIGKEHHKGGELYAPFLGGLAGSVVSVGLYQINHDVGIYSLPFLVPAGGIIGYQLSCPKASALGKDTQAFYLSPIAYFSPILNGHARITGTFGIHCGGTF